jgi:hypothetical protein
LERPVFGIRRPFSNAWGREAFWEKLYGEPGFGIWMGNFRDILVDRQANALISDFVARKIRQRRIRLLPRS